MAAIVVLTTTHDRRSGQKIAKILVQKKVAACVSLCGGLRSVYRWKSRIRSSSEALLIIKTSRNVLPKLKKELKAVHPYETPELLALPVAGGSAEYLKWIENLGL